VAERARLTRRQFIGLLITSIVALFAAGAVLVQQEQTAETEIMRPMTPRETAFARSLLSDKELMASENITPLRSDTSLVLVVKRPGLALLPGAYVFAVGDKPRLVKTRQVTARPNLGLNCNVSSRMIVLSPMVVTGEQCNVLFYSVSDGKAKLVDIAALFQAVTSSKPISNSAPLIIKSVQLSPDGLSIFVSCFTNGKSALARGQLSHTHNRINLVDWHSIEHSGVSYEITGRRIYISSAYAVSNAVQNQLFYETGSPASASVKLKQLAIAAMPSGIDDSGLYLWDPMVGEMSYLRIATLARVKVSLFPES
jgi:hypothetical protein